MRYFANSSLINCVNMEGRVYLSFEISLFLDCMSISSIIVFHSSFSNEFPF